MSDFATIPPTPDSPSDPERTDLLFASAVSTSASGDGDSPDATALPERPSGRSAAAIPLPDFVARYRVTREIARGGMGVILGGADPDLSREVAIKVMLPNHLNKPGYRERFVEEARITGTLQHPGIVPVYEVGQLPDTRPFFAMQLVEGETLDAQLAARKNPADNLPHFLQVFEGVCQTLAYAHRHGVFHRDVKPLNVMVGPFGVVKVMDWGVACRKDDPGRAQVEKKPECASGSYLPRLLHSPGLSDEVIGTPAYMSPEQAQGTGRGIDERTDVFGLGGILCAILTGSPPYTGTKTRKVHARAARADLGEAFGKLDASPAARELVLLAKKCLAPHQNARPRDALEVAAALTAYIESDLRRAERDLVRFFELSPDLFCIAGMDGYFRRVNENFTRVLGYTPTELISRPFIDFVHPDDRASTSAAAEQLALGKPVVHFRNRYRDVRGGYRWFDWDAKSIPEEGIVFAVARVLTEK